MKQGFAVLRSLTFSRRWVRATMAILTGIMLVLVFSGVKRFFVWPQITSKMGMQNPFEGYQSLLVPETLKFSKKYMNVLQQYESASNKNASTKKLSKIDNRQRAELGKRFDSPEDQASFEEALDSLVAKAPDGFLLNHAHTLRFTLMKPVIAMAEATGINLHVVFSLEVVLLIIFISMMMDTVVRFHLQVSEIYLSHLFMLGLCTLSLWMNGRMFFSIFAATLLLWLDARCQSGRTPKPGYMLAVLALILLCASVSTGVYVAIFAALGAWALFFQPQRSIWPFLALLIGSPYVYTSVMKNFHHFNGDIISVFYRHGIMHLLNSPVKAGLAFLACLTAGLNYKKILPKPYVNFPLVAALCGLGVATMGHSVATTAIPPLCVLAILKTFLLIERFGKTGFLSRGTA